MILIAGGTGQLGRQIVRLLNVRGERVRILTRYPDQSSIPQGNLIEIVAGDVRDLPSVERAMEGVTTVISAMHGFTGTNDSNPKTVDHLGNRNLIEASKRSGVRDFIMLSINGVSADHPMELFRMKFLAEQELRASGLSWTIIRPTAYMETWARIIGEPLMTYGKTRLFGRGRNPINFISVHDVARVVERATFERSMRGEVLEIGGPENLSMRQFVETFTSVTGKTGKVSAVPLPMMRVMSVLMRPLNATIARQIQAGIVMDTTDQTFATDGRLNLCSTMTFTTLAEMVQRDFGGAAER